MSTARNESADTRNDKEKPRERGGQTPEDRAKSLEGSAGPFDSPPTDQKRKE
jgi:hypothetical protein